MRKNLKILGILLISWIFFWFVLRTFEYVLIYSQCESYFVFSLKIHYRCEWFYSLYNVWKLYIRIIISLIFFITVFYYANGKNLWFLNVVKIFIQERVIKYIKKKHIIFVLILLIISFLLSEFHKLYIDYYNFKQLKIVKDVFELKPQCRYTVRNLTDFNEKYGMNIKPLKNCYEISTYNGDQPYIFWFQLYSIVSKVVYGSHWYAYPKYDKPVHQMCVGFCYDVNKTSFERKISESCRWNISWYVYYDDNWNWKKEIHEKWVSRMWVARNWSVVFTDSTWFYSFDVDERYDNDIRVQFPRWHFVKDKGYKDMKVWRGENIRAISFWVWVRPK